MTASVATIIALAVIIAAPFYLVWRENTPRRFKLLLCGIPIGLPLLLLSWGSSIGALYSRNNHEQVIRQIRETPATLQLEQVLHEWLDTPGGSTWELKSKLSILGDAARAEKIATPNRTTP